ncbi:shikimate kinase [Oscillospiraceae bacterium MB08-C2-2]|nr:shikimate kinase [Oscillospiraceae bacterium MB08-C2-2]
MDKNIFLCGFMGSGKTTVGQALAGLLGRPYHDLDNWIITAAGMPVSEIFAQKGEGFFRDVEHQQVVLAGGLRGAVVATGGGAVTFDRNLPPLRENGALVYLNPGFDACYNRIADDPFRPIVQSNTRESLWELYQKRHRLYSGVCDFSLDQELTPEESAKRIADWWNSLK